MTAEAEHLRHFFLDQIVDDNLGTIEGVARRHRISPYQFDFFRRSAIFPAADTAQARGTLFPIILYVNLYCGRLPAENRAMPEIGTSCGTCWIAGA
jgi:hypothetical protein